MNEVLFSHEEWENVFNAEKRMLMEKERETLAINNRKIAKSYLKEHSLETAIDRANDGNLTKERKSCQWYKRWNKCRYGEMCVFRHDKIENMEKNTNKNKSLNITHSIFSISLLKIILTMAVRTAETG